MALPEGLLRRDSLFVRLLVTQLLLALALAGLFTGLFYVERNVTVAQLVAERWAPALREAAGVPSGAPAPNALVERRQELPATAVGRRVVVPALLALRSTLREHGLAVDAMAMEPTDDGPRLWLHLAQADAASPPSIWLGVPSPLIGTHLPLRLLLGLALGAALLVGASWLFTRRLTRPLEQLRRRMAAQQPGIVGSSDAAPTASASPEVQAIGSAYDALLARFRAHERERALLLAGVSHDLRAPLSRIRLAAELLTGSTEVAARRETIVRNTAAADALIESFLDHVRSGELPLDERVDLAALCRALVRDYGRDAAELTVVAPEGLWVSHTNRLLLERVSINLIDNALRHGAVPIVVRLLEVSGRVILQVEDAGSGIAPDQQPLLVRAFARADASRHTPGSGLGLATVASVVARLRGELRFFHEGERFVASVEWPASP